MRRDSAQLAQVRDKVRGEMGDEQLVDAIAIAGNFQRMVRIADGTGDSPGLVRDADHPRHPR